METLNKTEMRKFKFVGTENERLDYSLNESQRPIYGKVYDEYHVVGGFNPLDWIDDRLYGHEWQEVFDTIEDKITELKEIAKSQGMDCEVVLKEADVWNGVEYVQYISPRSSCTTQRKTYKVKHITQRSVWIEIDDNGSTTTSLLIEKCKPSTESAYVEQLRKKALELYGEIKEGDRFAINSLEWMVLKGSKDFIYTKQSDSFSFGNMLLYKQGQWATRVPKKIEVDFGWTTGGSDRVVFDFFHRDQDKPSSIGVSLFEKRDYYHIKKCGDFLAKQLETYLNENK